MSRTPRQSLAVVSSAAPRSAVVAAFVAALLTQAAGAAGTSIVMSAMAPTLGGAIVQKKIAVKYDDVNPADPQGAAALLSRLNKAADALCSNKSPMLADKVAKCQAHALQQAVKEIDVPELTAAAKNAAK